MTTTKYTTTMNNLFQNLSTSDSEGESTNIPAQVTPAIDDGFTKVNNVTRKNRGRNHQREIIRRQIESPISKVDNSHDTAPPESDNDYKAWKPCTKTEVDNDLVSLNDESDISKINENVTTAQSVVTTSSSSLTPKDIRLESKWRYWTHEKFKQDWSIDSYHKLIVISTVSEFWKVFNNIDKLNGLEARYYFMMRGEIDPIWEHPKNRNGIIWSVQVSIEHIDAVWQRLCTLITGESLIPPEQTLSINGISTVLREVVNNGKNGGTAGAKETFYLIKIWLCRNIDIQKHIISALKDITSLRDMSIRQMQLRPEW